MIPRHHTSSTAIEAQRLDGEVAAPSDAPPAEKPSNPWRLEDLLIGLMFLVFPLDAIVPLSADANTAGEGITLTHVCTVLLVGVCALRALWNKDAEPLRLLVGSVPIFFLWAELVVYALSMLYARSTKYGLEVIFQRGTVFAFYLTIVYAIRDRRGLKLAIGCFVGSALFCMIAGTYEMATGKPVIDEQRISATMARSGLQKVEGGGFRIHGLGYEPDMHGAQLIIQMGLMLYLVSLPRTWGVWLAGLAFWFWAMANVVATSSRAAWLGLGVTLATFLLIAPLRRKLVIIGAAGAVLASVFLVLVVAFPDLGVVSVLKGKKGTKSFSTRFRAEMIEMSYAMGRQNLLLGVGTGNFADEYSRFSKLAPIVPRKVVPTPHNIYMAIFAENGLIGLFVYSMVHLTICLQILWCFWKAKDTETRLLAAGLFASLLGFVHCLNFYTMWGNKYGYAVMAFAGALARVMDQEFKEAATGVPLLASRREDHAPVAPIRQMAT